jgi:hypothetical protein
MILVHGVCVANGKEYSHAWVEYDGHIYNAFMIFGQREWVQFTHSDFRQYFNPVEEYKYTLFQMSEENRRTKTFGPWVQKLLDLCSSSHTTLGEVTMDGVIK